MGESTRLGRCVRGTSTIVVFKKYFPCSFLANLAPSSLGLSVTRREKVSLSRTRTRDVIFRNMTNWNQTDTNPQKLNTKQILFCRKMSIFNQILRRSYSRYRSNTNKSENTKYRFGRYWYFLVYQIFGYRLTSLTRTHEESSCLIRCLMSAEYSRHFARENFPLHPSSITIVTRAVRTASIRRATCRVTCRCDLTLPLLKPWRHHRGGFSGATNFDYPWFRLVWLYLARPANFSTQSWLCFMTALQECRQCNQWRQSSLLTSPLYLPSGPDDVTEQHALHQRLRADVRDDRSDPAAALRTRRR